VQLINTRHEDISLIKACDAVGLARCSYYRSKQVVPSKIIKKRYFSPRKLSSIEQNRLIEILHSPEFSNQPPAEIYAKLLSEGIYVASIRTMYRVLEGLGENNERRRQRAPIKHTKPVLSASGPNQVFTWDITKLSGEYKGKFYFNYVVLDLYSRYVVGWMVAEKESASLATEFICKSSNEI
jgi:putative transposase